MTESVDLDVKNENEQSVPEIIFRKILFWKKADIEAWKVFEHAKR